MGILRQVSDETEPLALDDEGSFIEVRKDIGKREMNTVIATLPPDVQNGGLTAEQANEFAELLFNLLVRGWSLSVPATVENYYTLTAEASMAIDMALAEHFNRISGVKQEGKEPSTSPDSLQKG